MNAFREFVQHNLRWFAGRGHESPASLDEAESRSGITVPDDLRWLLTERGYWHATGISSLEETISDTIAAREYLGLP
jgi:hypothetical protein